MVEGQAIMHMMLVVLCVIVFHPWRPALVVAQQRHCFDNTVDGPDTNQNRSRETELRRGFHLFPHQRFGDIVDVDVARKHMGLSQPLMNSLVHKVLRKHDNEIPPIRVLTVGGSGSACGQYPHCWTKITTTRMYDNLQRFRTACNMQATVDVVLDSMAHGSTTTEFSFEFLASLQGPEEHDLVLIEYAVNDGNRVHDKDCKNRHTDLLIRHLLRRNPKACIVFVYFWTSSWIEYKRQHNFGEDSWRDNLPLMQKYQDAGYDVNWVNVGGYFNERGFWKDVLRDHHHPNARAESFIADLVNLLLIDKIVQMEDISGITSAQSHELGTTSVRHNLPPDPEFSRDSLAECRFFPNAQAAWFHASCAQEDRLRWHAPYDLESCRMNENIDSVLYEEPTNSPEVPESYERLMAGIALPLRADRQYGIVVPLCTDVREGKKKYVPIDLSKGYTHLGGKSRFGTPFNWRFRDIKTHEAYNPALVMKLAPHDINGYVNLLYDVTNMPLKVIGVCADDSVNGTVTVNSYYMMNCKDYVFPVESRGTTEPLDQSCLVPKQNKKESVQAVSATIQNERVNATSHLNATAVVNTTTAVADSKTESTDDMSLPANAANVSSGDMSAIIIVAEENNDVQSDVVVDENNTARKKIGVEVMDSATVIVVPSCAVVVMSVVAVVSLLWL